MNDLACSGNVSCHANVMYSCLVQDCVIHTSCPCSTIFHARSDEDEEEVQRHPGPVDVTSYFTVMLACARRRPLTSFAFRRASRSVRFSSTASEKPYYVTTPIFYPNAGTSARWQSLQHPLTARARSSTRRTPALARDSGHLRATRAARAPRRARTFPHGHGRARTQDSAGRPRAGAGPAGVLRHAQRAVPCVPSALTWSEKGRSFWPQDLCEKANISHTKFLRTSASEHKRAVEHLWVCLFTLLEYIRSLASDLARCQRSPV
jgi:hypothetical protein